MPGLVAPSSTEKRLKAECALGGCNYHLYVTTNGSSASVESLRVVAAAQDRVARAFRERPRSQKSDPAR